MHLNPYLYARWLVFRYRCQRLWILGKGPFVRWWWRHVTLNIESAALAIIIGQRCGGVNAKASRLADRYMRMKNYKSELSARNIHRQVNYAIAEFANHLGCREHEIRRWLDID